MNATKIAISVVVLLACIVVGPFIATIMYLLLLNRVRLAIDAIRARQAPLPELG